MKISKSVEEKQINSINKIKKNRNNTEVTKKLIEVEKACKSKQNLVPKIIEAVMEYATLGEIVDAMKTHFGDWNENSII